MFVSFKIVLERFISLRFLKEHSAKGVLVGAECLP